MKKYFLTFGILILLLLSGVTFVNSSQPFDRTVDIEDQGIFEAELGRGRSDDPIVTLEGNYQRRGRIITFSGTAFTEDKEGRFRGGFRGNNFAIQIPIIGRALTIFGRFRINDDDNTFQGVWIARGIPARGWITGTLS